MTSWAHIICRCEECAAQWGDQAERHQANEWLTQLHDAKKEIDRLKAEHLLDLKDKNTQIEDVKAWTVALYAHVCRLTGKDPKDAPDEIRKIAQTWHSATIRAVEEDRDAYRAALGYEVPGDCTGRLRDGTTPQCGFCAAKDAARGLIP